MDNEPIFSGYLLCNLSSQIQEYQFTTSKKNHKEAMNIWEKQREGRDHLINNPTDVSSHISVGEDPETV